MTVLLLLLRLKIRNDNSVTNGPHNQIKHNKVAEMNLLTNSTTSPDHHFISVIGQERFFVDRYGDLTNISTVFIGNQDY